MNSVGRTRSLWKGSFAGALGGAVGTALLIAVQKASLESTRKAENVIPNGRGYTKQQEKLMDIFEQAHIATAEALGATIPAGKRSQVAFLMEFAFGIVCGAIYGGVAEYAPATSAGFGSIYGAVLFTGASEIVLPAIGFVPSPGRRTLVQHLGGLGGNVVYGIATEGTRRLLRTRA